MGAAAGGRTPRVAVLSAVFPEPPDGGNKVVLGGLVRYFASRLGAEHVHYILVGDAPATHDQPCVVHAVPRPSTRTRVRSVIGRTVLGPSSFQESLLWSPRIQEAVEQVLEDADIDVVVVDTVRMAQYITVRLARRRTTICYLDDLFSERYRSMLRLLDDTGAQVRLRPLATFAPMVPKPLRWLTDWRPTQRAILGLESRRVAHSEERTAREFDTCLLVNAGEAQRLRGRVTEHDPRADIRAVVPLAQLSSTVVPRPRSAIEAAGPLGRTFAGAPHFVVMGVMSAPHNDLAARWLVGEVVPRLLELVPGLRLDVIGRSPSPELRALARRVPDTVRLLGFVPDPVPHLQATCALLNPPRFASGVKLKVLDALAVGTPVVSTTAGIAGIGGDRTDGVFVADTPDDFAAAMSELCDPEVNTTASRAAARYCAERFSPEAVFAQYDAVFRGVVPPLPPPRAASG